MWKIYKHTFPNGKVYIGQTKQELQNRFKQGYGYEACPLVWKAILKYGWDSVVTDVIEDNITTLEEANEKECYYIKLYNSTNPNYGYNSAIGVEQFRGQILIEYQNFGIKDILFQKYPI